jgi:Ca2+-binding RTX toxin-like protein
LDRLRRPFSDTHFGHVEKLLFDANTTKKSISIIPGQGFFVSYIDFFEGDARDDFFEGGEGHDTLIGHGGADSLFGFEGDDLLIGGEGNDSLDGGDGVDTASYAGSTAQVIANLADHVGGGDDAGADTLVGIENLIGGSGDDILYGDTGDNLLFGGDGRDILIGRDGDDTLQGGDGDDAFSSGAGNDILDGGEGIDRAAISGPSGIRVDLRIQGVAQDTGQGMDTLISIEQLSATPYSDLLNGNDADNWIWGGTNYSGTTGDDTISGWGGDDLIQLGAAGNHVLDGGDGIDTVSFEGTAPDFTTGAVVSLALQGQEQDTGQGHITLTTFENLSGSRFGDTLSGDGGDNVLAGHMGADSLSGGAGNDTLLSDSFIVVDSHTAGTAGPVIIIQAGNDADTLDGGAGDDLLRGGGANDVLFGGTGDDTLNGGTGDDSLDGGDGIDTVDYSDAGNGVVVDLGLGTARKPWIDTLSNIENVVGSEYADTLTGDAAANRLSGGLGDDTLHGGSGDDVLIGGAGNDTLDGGLGIDTVSYAGSTVRVNVYLADGEGGGGDAGADTLVDIENLIGGSGSDDLIGDDANNFFAGGEGHDYMSGGLGDDTLQAQAGDDAIGGGLGNDILDGGEGYDRVGFFNSGIGVTVDLRLQGVAQNTGMGMDTLIGIEHLSGSLNNDHLIGDDGDNFLSGSWNGAGDTGDDTLSGMGGDDLMFVGAGDHVLDGGDGLDTVAFDWDPVSRGPVTASLALQGQPQDTGWGMMTLSGFENLSGTWWNDTLTGDDGNNHILGFHGDNLLSGGAGDDILGVIRLDMDTLASEGTAGPIGLIYDGGVGDNTLDGGLGDDQLQGGGRNDLLIGGAGDDKITASLGEDTVDGGAGIDTVVFAGGSGDYGTRWSSGDEIEVDGPGGSLSVIRGVEHLRFDDVTLDAKRAPTGADGGVSLLVGATKVFAAVDFGFSDFDGDALEAVIVDILPQSGVLRLDGVAVTAGQSVSATDIAGGKLVFTPDGVGSASFTFRVQDDGSGWGERIDASANTLTIGVTNPPSPEPDPPATPPVITDGATGTSGDDVATFTAANDSFSAGGGADAVSGGAGDDWLHGNAGADTISGGVGDDVVYGGKDDDLLSGDDGDDMLFGDAGDDTVHGGLGNDSVQGGEGSNYLRGDAGDDALVGGSGFDNLHGNAGDDTVSGGLGDDWVVGGKDNDVVSGGDGGDVVSGDLGDDVVSGNQGDDVLDGGLGDDIVRGGQGEDIVNGGAGDDYVSGGRGSDTISGGAGADRFHSFADAGIDRVLDFGFVEGDRVLLDPGTAYTVAQIGADVVIGMTGGEMTLVGVQLSTLGDGWIVGV